MNLFKINDKVKIKDINIYGKIIRINNKLALIQTNNKIIKTSLNNIEIYEYNEPKKEISIAYSRNYTKPSNEIKLRHKTKDEAIFLLDNFINEILSTNIDTIKIVHGKNGGIIRNAVHDYLKRNKNIESFRLGNYFEGQYGVTIAKIKK